MFLKRKEKENDKIPIRMSNKKIYSPTTTKQFKTKYIHEIYTIFIIFHNSKVSLKSLLV